MKKSLGLVGLLVSSLSIHASTIVGDDYISINGKDWAQVDLFINLSVNDIRVTCNPICSKGQLNGYDMDGWIFASRPDITALVLPDGNTFPSSWAPRMFDILGFRPTHTIIDGRAIFGRTADTFFDNINSEFGYSADVWDFESRSDQYTYDGVNNVSVRQSIRGAWFYRTSEVPLPASAWLFGSALLGLFGIRRANFHK